MMSSVNKSIPQYRLKVPSLENTGRVTALLLQAVYMQEYSAYDFAINGTCKIISTLRMVSCASTRGKRSVMFRYLVCQWSHHCAGKYQYF